MKIIDLFSKLYWKVFVSPEKEARHLGVTIGNNCLISTRYWSSEPYMITIGNNVQVTDNVSFHTHGGGKLLDRHIPILIVLDEFGLKIGFILGLGRTLWQGLLLAKVH